MLTGAARGWIIFAIVWGSILYIGQAGVQSAIRSNNNSTAVSQYNSIVSGFNATGTAVQRAGREAQTCSTVQCVRPSHLAAADSFSRFAGNLRGMSLPANATGSANLVANDADHLSTIFTDLANSSDPAAYQATEQRSNLAAVLNSYAGHTQSLLSTLRSDI